MRHLVVVNIIVFFIYTHGSLGAIIIRNLSSGKELSRPPLTLPIDSTIAFHNTLKGMSGFSPTVSGRTFATMVTPAGAPPKYMADGIGALISPSGFSEGIGSNRTIVHPASCSRAINCQERLIESGASLEYKISTGALGFPSRAFKNAPRLIVRGATFCRSCSSFSSASAAFCSACFADSFNLAISSLKYCSFALFVRKTITRAMAVSPAPPIKTKFDTVCQKEALSNEPHIDRPLFIFGMFVIVIIFFVTMVGLIYFGKQIWKDYQQLIKKN
jgi:hypothetical protein